MNRLLQSIHRTIDNPAPAPACAPAAAPARRSRRSRNMHTEQIIGTAAKAVEPLVYLHAGVLIIVEGTAGHAISFDLDPIKLCRFSGADRLLDCFKYILFHVPLTAGLFHRGLVSGGFRTLTGSFAALGAVWLPD